MNTETKEASFTNQKPFVVSKERLEAFTRHRKRFGCVLCSKVFKVGDTARWVYANGTPGLHTGNFFVCEEHDTEDVLERAKESIELATRLAKQWDIYGPDWERQR